MSEVRPDAGDQVPAAFRYGAMRWNTPLSEQHAELLLDRLDPPPATSVLDLGCGWGELLLRAVVRGSDAGLHGIGVDTAVSDLERARQVAGERGVADRVRFIEGSAVDWKEPADRVLCIGAAHAWGGTAGALDALRRLVRPGGRLLFGDGFWRRSPTPAAVDIFGEDLASLGRLVRTAHAGGWRVLHLSEADQLEWDDFESTWRLGRQRWLEGHLDSPVAAELKSELEKRLLEYVEVYRDVLGFGYLVLTH